MKKNKIVSIKLKEYLQKNNISQAQLAERAGMRKNTVSEIANNKKRGIKFDSIERIAKALNISDIREIIDFVDDEGESKNDS